MELIEKKLSELIPYANNPRKNDGAVDAVMESIKQCGYISPIVIDENNEILAGHTRYKAMKKLKIKTAKCVVMEGLTEEQKRKYRILDNKTGEFAEWDVDLLNIELEGLDFEGFDFGFDLPKEEEEKEIVEDEVPEVDETVEPTAKLGDIWQLGRHRLMCGDSTDKETVELLMGGNKADMVLSDPPYGMFLDTDFSDIKGSMKSIGRKNHTQGNKYDKVIGDNEDFTPELITTFFKNFGYCKEMFLFGADYFAEILPDKNEGSWLVWDKRKESQADAIGSEFELCWSKSKHKRRMLRHDWFGFLSSQNGADARNRVHPTQKPITLLVDIIEQWGKDCENIVDVYGGSGSTLIACEQLDRNCYMMELDPKYVDVIIKRWEDFTGEKAVLLNG
ncbi:MAG: DNA methyltransferase [Bacteroidales bacterium]|nr:DNA methyltransferase [Bacteroidales bacterium]